MLRTATFALVALVCLPAWGQTTRPDGTPWRPTKEEKDAMRAVVRDMEKEALPHDRPLLKGTTGKLPYYRAKIVAVAKDGVVVEASWQDARTVVELINRWDSVKEHPDNISDDDRRETPHWVLSIYEGLAYTIKRSEDATGGPIRKTLWLETDTDGLHPGDLFLSSVDWQVAGVKPWLSEGKRTTIPHLRPAKK